MLSSVVEGKETSVRSLEIWVLVLVLSLRSQQPLTSRSVLCVSVSSSVKQEVWSRPPKGLFQPCGSLTLRAALSMCSWLGLPAAAPQPWVVSGATAPPCIAWPADLLQAGAVDPSLKVIMGTSLFPGGLIRTNKNCLHLNTPPGEEIV